MPGICIPASLQKGQIIFVYQLGQGWGVRGGGEGWGGPKCMQLCNMYTSKRGVGGVGGSRVKMHVTL